MASPLIVPSVMTLYAPFCPEGRVFQKGEDWPGDAWSANPAGKEAETGAQLLTAMESLATAEEEIERLRNVILTKDASLAQLGKTRDEAVAEAKGMKQTLLDAQQARKEAEQVARDLTKERDRARQEAEALRHRLAGLEAAPESAGKPEKTAA